LNLLGYGAEYLFVMKMMKL